MHLIKKQQAIANEHFDSTLFVEGVSGTGKTTAAIERVKSLVKAGVPADSILVIVPQAMLALPYRTALRRARVKTAASVRLETLGSLAFETVSLFWPLVADRVGFAHPRKPPHFLSLELVQYYMTRLVGPVIDRNDYFNSVHISRSRLYTQIVDNLNKAALVGFSYQEIGERLKSAWEGDVEQAFIYNDAQAAASTFREICLRHNMLDFSLQVNLFIDHLWPLKPVRAYLTKKYRHLIVDNLEEDTPATHDLLRDWLPACESAVLIYDSGGGYRRFLGADPVNAYALREQCAHHVELDRGRVMSADIEAFQAAILPHLGAGAVVMPKDGDPRAAIRYPAASRYHTEMIDWAVEQVAALVHDQGVAPREIAILAPFVPDALRFALQTRLTERGVTSRTHRPSRALREEPAVRALLTLAKLAHPDWKLALSAYDVTYALAQAIADLDLVRARLLTDELYRDGRLLAFEHIREAGTQMRITFELGALYEVLRGWLDAYREGGEPLPLDVFFSRLFGEVLSQPSFGFHRQIDAASAAANLIDSARQFRLAVGSIEPELAHAPEYVRMVDAGVIANLYLRDWAAEKQDAVLISPAYTFLMRNEPVDYQVWLNIGASGWAQRLNQPLTHPYVLSRQWPQGAKWTDADDVNANRETLIALVTGLTRRCRKGIYLGYSDYGEQGTEPRGPLLMAAQNMLRRLAREEAGHV